MRSHLRRWRGLRSRSLVRPLHLAAACALILALGWLPAGLTAPARAIDLQADEQPGVDGNAYESPSWGYTLEWDEEVWEVELASSQNNRDRLLLARAETDGRLFVDGYDSFDIDPPACDLRSASRGNSSKTRSRSSSRALVLRSLRT